MLWCLHKYIPHSYKLKYFWRNFVTARVEILIINKVYDHIIFTIYSHHIIFVATDRLAKMVIVTCILNTFTTYWSFCLLFKRHLSSKTKYCVLLLFWLIKYLTRIESKYLLVVPRWLLYLLVTSIWCSAKFSEDLVSKFLLHELKESQNKIFHSVLN